MPISNHGPFEIFAANGMELRMFVCEDGIVIVRPSFIRHLPGQFIGQFGGALFGGIGGAVEGAMSTKEYRKTDQKAEGADFTSTETLTALLPRSRQYSTDQIEAITLKKSKLVFTTKHREPRLLYLRKGQWRVGKDKVSVQTALGELFGDRFQILN